MRVRYENWVNGLQGDWNITRQRFFGVPVPGLVPDRRRRRRSTTSRPILAGEDRLPVDPTTDARARLRRRPARQARRVHRRPRRHGHVGHVVAARPQIATGWIDDPDLFARTFPMDLRPAGPRHHPDLALLHGGPLALRARRRCRGPTPPSRASSSTPTARSCRSRPANAPDDPAALIDRYGADGVRYWAANGRPGMDVVVRRGPAQDRPQAGASSCSTRRSSPSALGSTTAGEVTEPLDRSMLAGAGRPGRRGHRRLRPLRLRPGHRAHRGLLLVVLRRLPRAGQEPGLRRRGRRRRRRSARTALGPGAAHAARPVRPVPAVRHRRGVVVVAGGLGPPVAVAVGRRAARGGGRRRRRVPGRRARPGGAGRGRRRARRGPRGQERGQAVDAHRGHLGRRHRHARAAGAAGAGRGRRPLGGPHRRR